MVWLDVEGAQAVGTHAVGARTVGAGEIQIGGANVVEYRLVGQVEVWADGRSVDAGQPRQRAILAALLVDAGRPVSWETLVDRVWGDSANEGARHTLHTYLARIRKLLTQVEGADGAAKLVHRSGVYVLDVDPDTVDLHRFRRLVDQSRGPDRTDAERSSLLRQALALWRGDPLAGLSGDWPARVREAGRGQRLEATLAWAQAELRMGEPAAVIGPLHDLLADHPLVEPVAAVLMRALHAAGRTAEALDCYTSTRKRLVNELGTEPGTELAAVHQAVLRGELPVPTPGSASRPAAPPVAVPAQLPLVIRGFAGRESALAQLNAVLDEAGQRPTGVVITALLGTAGVGKTALAVRWGHLVADRFPDGQLYVNLRGFDPGGSAMSTAEAVRGFLDAFGVSPQRVPASLPAQIGLYRSLMAGRRVLVVLDNARDAEQVRALLPGSPGSLVLVTSRNQLTSLVAVEGAQPVTLTVLPPDEARLLLARRIGTDRVAAEPTAVAEIITRCARLPLALALVAARAASHPAFSLASLAGELREARGRLDAFDGGDPATNVRAVFSWSYEQLSPEAARLFRLLGLQPGEDVAAPAAASLACAPLTHTRLLLGELARAHLLTEHSPGRFAYHDLLRAYATELVWSLDAETERQTAQHRILDHYLHTATRAALLLNPHRDPITLLPPQPGAVVEELPDHERALAWFTAERATLTSTVEYAATVGFDHESWQVAWSLANFLQRLGRWADQIATQTTALAAARRLADIPGQAHMQRYLGRSLTRMGRYEEAGTHLRAALELFGQLGDYAAQAYVHLDLGLIYDLQQRPQDALGHAEQALELFRVADHVAGQANALNAVGWVHAHLGDHESAIVHCEQALELHSRIGDQHSQAGTWDSLGFAHHQLGHHDRATECYRQALDIYNLTGDRYNQSLILRHLGDNHHGAGDLDGARTAWGDALSILDGLDHPEAEEIRAKLAAL